MNLIKPNALLIGLIFALLLIFGFGCATVLYGYKEVTDVDRKWSAELAAKAGVEPQNVLYIDSLETVKLGKLICGPNAAIQPMQLHCVIADSIVSSYFNCYAKGGVRNIHWRFEDSNHSLIEGDCYSEDPGLNMQLRELTKIETEDLLIVVFSSMFKSQSEDLVRTVATRSAGFTLLLINIDAYYITN